MTLTDAHGKHLEPLLLHGDGRKREHLIRCFYEAKIQHLSKQLAIVDKKAYDLARSNSQ